MRGRRVFVAAAMAAAACLVAGCGAATAGPDRSSTSTTAPVSTSTIPTTTTTVAVAPGTALEVSGAGGIAATVTFSRLVDPASPAYSFETVGAGLRFVAVQLTVANRGTVPIDESAQAATTVVDDTGHTIAAVIDELVGCPGFPGGVVDLAPGASATGCVAFELPSSAKVHQVRFAFGGALATSVAEWQLP